MRVEGNSNVYSKVKTGKGGTFTLCDVEKRMLYIPFRGQSVIALTQLLAKVEGAVLVKSLHMLLHSWWWDGKPQETFLWNGSNKSMNMLLECCQLSMQHIHYHVCRDAVVNVHRMMELLNPEANLSQKWIPGSGFTLSSVSPHLCAVLKQWQRSRVSKSSACFKDFWS